MDREGHAVSRDEAARPRPAGMFGSQNGSVPLTFLREKIRATF